MSDACRDRQPDLVAHLLGELTADERLGLQAHVEGCAGCRSELQGLTGLARLLPAADAEHVLRAPVPTRGLLERTVAAVGRESVRARSRGRRAVAARLTAVAAVAAVSAVVLFAGGSAGGGGAGGTGAHQLAGINLVAPDATATASAVLQPRAWGTQVVLAETGLPAGVRENVFLERADGTRVPAGTFAGISGKELHFILACALPAAQVRAVGISTDAGMVVLRAPVAGPRSS